MSNYVTVYIANGQLDAEIVRGFLEASGIPAVVSQESVGKVFGMASGPLGEVNVLVPDDRSDEALDLLDTMENGELIDDQDAGDQNDEKTSPDEEEDQTDD